jgi:hypothetical protein
MCLASSSTSRSPQREPRPPPSPLIKVSLSPQLARQHRVTPWPNAIEPGRRGRVQQGNSGRICAPRPSHPTRSDPSFMEQNGLPCRPIQGVVESLTFEPTRLFNPKYFRCGVQEPGKFGPFCLFPKMTLRLSFALRLMSLPPRQTPKLQTIRNKGPEGYGGEGGSRTHEPGFARLPAFEAGSFDHSDTSPRWLRHSNGGAAAGQRRTRVIQE